MSVSFRTRLTSLSLAQICQNLPEASETGIVDTEEWELEMFHYSVSLTAYTDS